MKYSASVISQEKIAEIAAMFASPPLMHLFRTEHSAYCFDSNSGEIVEINEVSERILSSLGRKEFSDTVKEEVRRSGVPKVHDVLNDILSLATEHTPTMLITEGPEIANVYDFEKYKYAVNNLLEQMTLCPTDACNLACHYCVYSGEVPSRTPHGSNVMSMDTLKAALKYFVEHSGDSSRRHIGFYGGEPTLTFDHIKYAFAYLSDALEEDVFTLGVTTNFADVTDEMIEYFADNMITLYISLDGPKELHDRYRRRPDGTGSFDSIIENLNRLKRYNSEYLHSHVLINATAAPPYRIDKIKDFFEQTDVASSNHVTVNYVSETEYLYADKPPEFFDNSSGAALRAQYLELASQGKLAFDSFEHLFLKKLFNRSAMRVYRRSRPKAGIAKRFFPGGVCILGKRRVFVRPDGSMFPCEKIPEYDAFNLGNVHGAFDVEKAFGLYDAHAALCPDECSKCWAITLCNSICIRDAYDENGPSREKKLRACESFKRGASLWLSLMCSVLERNPDAFAFLDDYDMAQALPKEIAKDP